MPLKDDSREVLEIQRVRRKIDDIDDKILDLLMERRELAIRVAGMEKEVHLNDHKKRIKEMLDRIELKADMKGLNGKNVREFWKALVEYMIHEQKDSEHHFY
ncbi:MAG: chorismate mutase [Candidatus Altiarchaeota archaeon]|nr:chorismate mutase [Candidatus Altiarchaeota archaeon]